MANQTVTNLHNEVLFNRKKETKYLYTTEMNLKNIMLSKKNRCKKPANIMHLFI